MAGTPFSITVSAVAPGGAIDTAYQGTVHFTSTDAQAVLPSDYTFTAADQGTHTFQVGLRRAGSQQVTITDAASSLTARVNVLVTPADASTFSVSGFPSPVRAGTVNTFTVRAFDAYGNAATNYVGTVHFTSTDGQAIVPHDYTFTTADAGSHVFAAVLRTTGSQQLIVTDTLVGDRTGSQSVTVLPGAAKRLLVAGYPSPTEAGSVDTFTVTAYDAYGNVVTDYRGTMHFTSTDPQAILPDDYTFTAADNGTHIFGAVLYTAGVQSLIAGQADGSLTGSEDGILVVPAAASYFVLTAPDQVQSDTVFTLTVTAYDAYGNVATGYTGTVGFASSDTDALVPQNYTFTTNDAGSHTFRFLLHQPGRQTITVLDQLMSTLNGSTNLTVLPAN